MCVFPQIHPHDMELSTVAQLDRTLDLTTVTIDRIQVSEVLGMKAYQRQRAKSGTYAWF